MKLKTAAAFTVFFVLIFITSCMTHENGVVERPEEPSARETEAYENIGKMINEGDSGSALKEFERIKDDDAESVIAYAGLLISAGDYEKAEEELKVLLEREPMNADAYFNLALIEGLRGNNEKEVDYLEKSIASDESHSEALSVMGSIYLSDSRLKKAAEMFERSLESDPDNIIALTGYGSTLIRQEKYEEAEPYLDRAVELDPENPFTYLDRSGVRAANGDPRGAESDMSSAIKLEPDYFWHYIDRGRLRLRDLGDNEGALDDFNRAIELDPSGFYPYVFRAGIYYDTGNYEQAAKDYKTVIKLKPDYYFAYSALGISQFMLGEWDGCRKSFEKAFEFEPEEYAYLATAAVAVMKQKLDYKKTQDYYTKLMKKIPAGDIYYHILRSFKENGYDVYALRKIKEDEDENLQKRLLFYIAELYLESGMETAAFSYLTLVSDAIELGFYEGKMAKNELEMHYE